MLCDKEIVVDIVIMLCENNDSFILLWFCVILLYIVGILLVICVVVLYLVVRFLMIFG